jgi:DNA (cytosine-5)-methyltransferase 1
MRMLDLFSGIGGFSLAASWVWGDELEIVAFCEIDKFCQKVLRKHWPNVPIIEDVKDVKETKKSINLLTAGPPCQPISIAGERRGKNDERFLWPETLSIVKKIRPNWIIFENPTGFIGMGVDDVLSYLEDNNYTSQAFIIPAGAVGAYHSRERVWVVANSVSEGLERIFEPTLKWDSPISKENIPRFERKASPRVCRRGHGISNYMDRIKSLGNAIVPQVAYQILKAIKDIEKLGCDSF